VGRPVHVYTRLAPRWNNIDNNNRAGIDRGPNIKVSTKQPAAKAKLTSRAVVGADLEDDSWLSNSRRSGSKNKKRRKTSRSFSKQIQMPDPSECAPRVAKAPVSVLDLHVLSKNDFTRKSCRMIPPCVEKRGDPDTDPNRPGRQIQTDREGRSKPRGKADPNREGRLIQTEKEG
jgi:hypothetical protein